MKILIILLMFLPSLCNKPLPERYDIVLCVGQSNMLGVAPIETQDSGSLAVLWNNTGWEQADGHLNRYSNIANAYGMLSMANEFGKRLGAQNRRQTGLVVNARGGSFIETWDTLYLAMSIRRLNDALAHNPGNRVTAILWHQGESNMYDAHNWMNHFKNIRRQVDTLLSPDVPILVGGLSTVHHYHRVLNDTMRKIETELHDCYFIPSDSLTTLDGTHFDSKSQREFGLRYYQRYKLTI